MTSQKLGICICFPVEKGGMRMDTVERVIWEIGGHVMQKCYRYLEDAVRYSMTLEQFPRGELTKQFYPAVAEAMGMRGKRAGTTVSRAVARAAADAWDYGNQAKIEEIAGREWRGKPMPGELIGYLRNYLLKMEGNIMRK